MMPSPHAQRPDWPGKRRADLFPDWGEHLQNGNMSSKVSMLMSLQQPHSLQQDLGITYDTSGRSLDDGGAINKLTYYHLYRIPELTESLNYGKKSLYLATAQAPLSSYQREISRVI